jgi:hypothetical protein
MGKRNFLRNVLTPGIMLTAWSLLLFPVLTPLSRSYKKLKLCTARLLTQQYAKDF